MTVIIVPANDGPRYEKMSKSRGNVVLPEEVVYGVRALDAGYEFRNPYNKVIDWQELGVWQDNLNTKFFFTATRYGRMPVFLHYEGNPMPALLLIDGEERLQHPNLINFWRDITNMATIDEIKEAVTAKVAEGNAALKAKVIDFKVEQELERRKNLALQGLMKLENAQVDFEKIQPDHVIKDENGQVLQKGFTEKRLADKKKAEKVIKDLQDALAKGLGDADWKPLEKLVGDKTSMPPPANTPPMGFDQ